MRGLQAVCARIIFEEQVDLHIEATRNLPEYWLGHACSARFIFRDDGA